ncbi:50S ribosomal protein L29 [Candidatus Nomurabacteria bacterium]|nr:50S ribosomal protein L29 [Candidatus Nomurabacteria bacterium]
MAKKKENLKEMNEGELKKNLALLEESVRVFRFKAEGARSKNVKEVKNIKRQIARILTEINSR